MKKLFLVVLSFVFSFQIFSQDNCDYLYDSIVVEDNIVIGSNSKGEGYYDQDTPVISMIDSDGVELWRIEDDLDDVKLLDIRLFYFSDNYLYALFSLAEGGYERPNKQVLKIDINIGEIVWKSGVYDGVDRDSESSLIDYDMDNILFYYPRDNNSGGSIGDMVVIKINKISSAEDVLLDAYAGHSRNFRMVKDAQGNLIHTHVNYGVSGGVARLRKINGHNFNSVIWDQSYVHPGYASLENIGELLIDDFGYIYAIRYSDGRDIFKINPINGSEIWRIDFSGWDQRIYDIKLRDNFMYIALAHAFVGSITSSFSVRKINLETGMHEWTSYDLHMTMIGDGSPTTGENEAIKSIDIDCNGDIYVTGYYGDTGYGPGAWGIMKIDGTDGSKINDLTITLDEANIDHFSIGKSVHVVNGEPIFLGQVQSGEEESSRAFVKTDENLSVIENFSDSCGVLSFNYNIDVSLNADVSEVEDVGDVINYTIGVTNTGYYALSAIQVNDPLLGGDMGLPISGDVNENTRLDGGETWIYEGSYTLTSEDMASGGIPAGSNMIHNEINVLGLNSLGVLEVSKNAFVDVQIHVISLDENLLSNLLVYPNPTNGVLFVEGERVNRIEVISILGKLVAEKLNSNTIDLSNREKGMYFLKLYTDKGIGVQKVILK